jgi:ABC-2 type transport system ATP-binding protein
MAVIEIKGLTKDFETGFWKKRPVRALEDLNLQVEKGEVFGFLGPNGAGKTTTLKLLMNLIRPTAGSATILGEPIGSVTMRRRIGYLPENPYFYDYLTAEEFLLYVGRLFGLSWAESRRKANSLLDSVGLAPSRTMQLRKFSKGMLQRIGIAQAVLNDPEVVFLDEPMSGLDPLGRREVRLVISTLREKGVTVFFSSHILSDVEALCDRVAIMNRGSLQAAGALQDILKVKIEGHEIILTRWAPDFVTGLKDLSDRLESIGDRLHVRAGSSGQLEKVLSYALAKGAELISVSPIRPSLEDYFFKEVGNRAAGGDTA